MEESTTYQAILARGRQEGELRGAVKEAQRVLLQLGRRHLGTAQEATIEAVQGIEDVQQLEQLIEGVNAAVSWDELLAQSLPRKRNSRRGNRARRKP